MGDQIYNYNLVKYLDKHQLQIVELLINQPTTEILPLQLHTIQRKLMHLIKERRESQDKTRGEDTTNHIREGNQ